ncbi:unnamed protein product [Prorocentrum cordatum]|uniref:Beta-carotene isomerase D27-like C-terminal domain-containing protein n=1 Tax=Prorocentrum cordatum TaxID=2364126 RepID=A0ABN9XKL2_9DINO|nr:unnamed protein product [Polarella glacialis]
MVAQLAEAVPPFRQPSADAAGLLPGRRRDAAREPLPSAGRLGPWRGVRHARAGAAASEAFPSCLPTTPAQREQIGRAAGASTGRGVTREGPREVNDAEGTVLELQTRARRVFEGILPSIFIGWVPPLWKKFVQPNVPQWSQNAAFFLVFYLLFPWLMGPMEGEDFIDVPVPEEWRKVLFFLPVSVRVPQSVKAERCRFLEQAQCASVCVNTCKVPSQEWLRDDFGMNLHIQPNYDDFSCRWRFGKVAPPLMEDEAIMSPCFTKCPTKVKSGKDAPSLRERLQREDDERLLKAVMELTPDGTALSLESLRERTSTTRKVGKCWSVDNNRKALREAAVSREAAVATP